MQVHTGRNHAISQAVVPASLDPRVPSYLCAGTDVVASPVVLEESEHGFPLCIVGLGAVPVLKVGSRFRFKLAVFLL